MIKRLVYVAGIGMTVWGWSYFLPASFHAVLSAVSITFNEIVGKFQ